MGTGPNGRLGRDAVSRVAVDDNRGPELAPTPLRNMAAKNAAELKKKCELAMIFHAQVNEFRFFPPSSLKKDPKQCNWSRRREMASVVSLEGFISEFRAFLLGQLWYIVAFITMNVAVSSLYNLFTIYSFDSQLMASGRRGGLGNSVHWPVVVEYKSHIARVPILSPRSEELTAREPTRGPEHAT